MMASANCCLNNNPFGRSMRLYATSGKGYSYGNRDFIVDH